MFRKPKNDGPLTGGCLCGAVRFTAPAPLRFEVCHCEDCRKWHGASAVGVDLTMVTLLSGFEDLKWYNHGKGAERGFCQCCGSSLFYRRAGDPRRWSIYHGSLDHAPADIPLGSQHFLWQKPKNYSIV